MTFVDLVVICNETKEAINIFYNSVIDQNSLDLNNAQSALYKLNHNDLVLLGDTAPLLHHFLNLYRLSLKTNDKKKIIEIMLQCLYLGFDSHSTYKNDPPLLFKSIILKELNLTKSIIENNPTSFYKMVLYQKQWLKEFLSILYSIPSEYVVPLAKLLLHVDTIIGSRVNQTSMEEIVYLLESADLGKPTVKPADLSLYSSTYHTILTSIGLGFPIKLVDIVRSLDEVAGSIHQKLLDVLVDIYDESFEIIISYLETLTATVITNSGLSPQNNLYPMGRNALHYLCISGGSIMLKQLTIFLQRIMLVSEDFPEKDLILSMFRITLISKDTRGHSPISYAVMRYSQNSLIFDELKSLCNLIHLDIEILLTEFPWIKNHYNTKQKTNIKTNEYLNSGGWSTIRKEVPQHMDDVCDIVEVYEKSLPSNKEFFAKYVNRGIPVIFRQVALSDSDTKTTSKYSDSMGKVRQVFQKDSFILNYGSFYVPSASIPYSESFGIKSSISTLAEVANSNNMILKSGQILLNGNMNFDELNYSLPLYTFCTPSQQWSSKLLGDIPVPRSIYRDLLDNDDSGIGVIDKKYSAWSFELQFYLGSADTGAPIHFHGHALNTLAYGEKQWVLFPPNYAFYSTTPAIKYFQNNSNFNENLDSNTLRCLQKAGDVLYVPALWGHGTLNTGMQFKLNMDLTLL